MDGSGIPRSINDAKTQYHHIAHETAASFLEIEATPEQWRAADVKAKANIDTQLENYKYVHTAEAAAGMKVMVIGATGSGKSATANTLIGHKWFAEAYTDDSEASVTSVTSEPCVKVFPIDNGILKANLVVCDTSGSWESQTKSPGLDGVDCYIIVINLATPRFSQETLTKARSLKGIDGALIVESGQFLVVLTHADSALQGISLNQYLDEIRGEPLHTFLTQVTEGRVLAINNAAETEYQRERQQLMLFALLAQVYNKVPLYNQPRKERTSSFKDGLTNVMSSAKRLGSLAVGEVFEKARSRLVITSGSTGETVHPPTHDGGPEARYTRSWSTSDPSVKTSQPLAEDVNLKGKDEPAPSSKDEPAPSSKDEPPAPSSKDEPPAPSSKDEPPSPSSNDEPQQQQQEQQNQQQHGQQEIQESSVDQQQPTGSSVTEHGDKQDPMGEENATSDKKEEQGEADLDK